MRREEKQILAGRRSYLLWRYNPSPKFSIIFNYNGKGNNFFGHVQRRIILAFISIQSNQTTTFTKQHLANYRESVE